MLSPLRLHAALVAVLYTRLPFTASIRVIRAACPGRCPRTASGETATFRHQRLAERARNLFPGATIVNAAATHMAENIGLRGYRVQDPARAEARRREIMLAMADVILEKGYAAATLEDVAARMGTSRAVIYYQFRSKDDIYVDICVEAVANAATRLEAIVAREDPADATLYAVLHDLIEVGMEPLNHSTLVTGRPRSPPDQGPPPIPRLHPPHSPSTL